MNTTQPTLMFSSDADRRQAIRELHAGARHELRQARAHFWEALRWYGRQEEAIYRMCLVQALDCLVCAAMYRRTAQRMRRYQCQGRTANKTDPHSAFERALYDVTSQSG